MKWKSLLGIIISAVFVLFILIQMDLNRIVSALRSVDYLFLVPVVLILIFTLFISAWRWRYLLHPVKAIRTPSLFSVTCIGVMTNMMLPVRAGDFVRAYMIGEKEQVSKTTCLATIVVERILDLLSILMILILLLVFVSFPLETSQLTGSLKIGGYVSGLLCSVVLGGLFLLKYRTYQTIKFITVWMGFLPRRSLDWLIEILKSFALGLQFIKKDWRLISIVFLTFALWMGYALSNFLILRSFNLHLPLYAAFLFLVFQAFGVMIPASPGFIGTYHAAVIAGFTFFDVSQELALSVAIIMHAAVLFPSVVLGLLCLSWEDVSLREIRYVKYGGLYR